MGFGKKVALAFLAFSERLPCRSDADGFQILEVCFRNWESPGLFPNAPQ